MELISAPTIVARATYPLPPTLNDQINSARSHWAKSAATKREWTNTISLLSSNLPKFPDKVWIELFYSVKTFSRRDPDNISASRKFLMDGLVQSGVIKSDSLKIVQSPIIEWFEQGKVDEVTIVISSRAIVEICKRHSGIGTQDV